MKDWYETSRKLSNKVKKAKFRDHKGGGGGGRGVELALVALGGYLRTISEGELGS